MLRVDALSDCGEARSKQLVSDKLCVGYTVFDHEDTNRLYHRSAHGYDGGNIFNWSVLGRAGLLWSGIICAALSGSPQLSITVLCCTLVCKIITRLSVGACLCYTTLRFAVMLVKGADDIQAGRARMSEAPNADRLSLSIELDYQVNPQGSC